jgi:formylglycine-generating enzyme required for sulfatase activity
MKCGRVISDLILAILVVLTVACSAGDGLADRADSVPPCTIIGQIWTSPIDGATLVCVPAGEFLMGAANDDRLAEDDERPQHRVSLKSYWIDRTEVTNARFAQCLTAGVCKPEVYETEAKTFVPYAVHPDYQDYPAFLYEAEATADYCQWAGRRLPTEAEWEKAARGTDGRRFPWGNDIDCAHATYYECPVSTIPPDQELSGPRCGYSYFCRTVQVEAHPSGASPYGALNMAGNVWEWVNDWYAPDYYSVSPADNPIGPAAGEYQVRRGGGTKSFASDLRVTARAGGQVSHVFDSQIGFRCAVSAQ